MSHDPTLEHDLSSCLNDKVAFLKRLATSVYNSNVHGLEGQKECLIIAEKCIKMHDAENSISSQLMSSINLHFFNIIQRKLDDQVNHPNDEM